MIIYIWAQDEQGLIGQAGSLPWHLPNDLRFFKEVTMGQTIVMGRKTFEGMNKRLLPNRHSVVVTSDETYDGNGAEIITDLNLIIDDARTEEIYVIGGAQLFEALKDQVEVLYCTKIHARFTGETYFPLIDWNAFSLVKQLEGTVDEKNQYPHTFEIYQRKGVVA